MIDINYYIEKSKGMRNTSHGGSIAYHFENVVLIKYQSKKKYGDLPRRYEEETAKIANKKNAMGNRTPAHLAVKRETDEEYNICWVLQQRANGQIFTNYCMNKDPEKQIAMQSVIASAPDSHFERILEDIMQLYNLGLEMKAKNLFYDESLNGGGFTIIDLEKERGNPFDANNLNDVVNLPEFLALIYNGTRISFPYSKYASEEQKAISKELYFKIRLKVFLAMQKVVPTFNAYERWVLRALSLDVLEYFSQNGIKFDSLVLTRSECEEFKNLGDKIIDGAVQLVLDGENVWSVGNYINLEVSSGAMKSSWPYHPNNNIKPEDFTGEFAYLDYKRATEESLKKIVMEAVIEKLKSLVATNKEVQKWLDEYEEKNARKEV